MAPDKWPTNIPTVTRHRMKQVKATDSEINALRSLLNEITAFSQYGYCEIDYDDFPILSSIWADKDFGMDYQTLFHAISAWFSGHRWEVVLSNLEILRQCQDPEGDTVEYRPDIAAGLALLDEQAAHQIQHEAYTSNWWEDSPTHSTPIS